MLIKYAKGLVTKTVLNAKITEVGNKIPDTSNLVTATALNTKLMKLRIKFLIMINIVLLLNLIS